jgi:hypothetical protein
MVHRTPLLHFIFACISDFCFNFFDHFRPNPVNPVFDVMSSANSSHRAEGASPPLEDVLPSKKAVTDRNLQLQAQTCS